jgi:hypothetical protein
VKQGIHEGDACTPRGVHEATEWTIDKFNEAKARRTCGGRVSGAQLN